MMARMMVDTKYKSGDVDGVVVTREALARSSCFWEVLNKGEKLRNHRQKRERPNPRACQPTSPNLPPCSANREDDKMLTKPELFPLQKKGNSAPSWVQ